MEKQIQNVLFLVTQYLPHHVKKKKTHVSLNTPQTDAVCSPVTHCRVLQKHSTIKNINPVGFAPGNQVRSSPAMTDPIEQPNSETEQSRSTLDLDVLNLGVYTTGY